MQLMFAIFVIPLILTNFFTILPANSKLLHVSELYRHGARYPIHDAYDFNETKDRQGQLSSIGLRQMYLLGSYIQHDYGNQSLFINVTLNPRQTQYFSVDADACLQSAYAHALGMFPYGKGAKVLPNIDASLLEPPFETIFPEKLRKETDPTSFSSEQFALNKGFQPVPVRYADAFFPECPYLDALISKRWRQLAMELARFQMEQTIFTEKMREIFKMSVLDSNLPGLQALADVVMSDTYLGRALPQQFSAQDYRQLLFVHGYIEAFVKASNISKILNGPIVNTIISNMERVINGSEKVKKYSSYSVQDINIVPLLSYYGMTSPQCLKEQFTGNKTVQNCADPVPFASSLIFQLHQNGTNETLTSEQSYFVKVRYNGDYYKVFDKPQIEIEFSEFRSKSQAGLLDFHKQCKVKSQEKQMDKGALISQILSQE